MSGFNECPVYREQEDIKNENERNRKTELIRTIYQTNRF